MKSSFHCLTYWYLELGLIVGLWDLCLLQQLNFVLPSTSLQIHVPTPLIYHLNAWIVSNFTIMQHLVLLIALALDNYDF